MSCPPEFKAVKAVWPDAEYWEESGLPYVFLPNLRFESGGNLMTMKALLCPTARDGYATRLFLEEQIANKGRNWKAHSIRGLTWWVCSWKNVPASLPWLEILANHLGPLR